MGGAGTGCGADPGGTRDQTRWGGGRGTPCSGRSPEAELTELDVRADTGCERKEAPRITAAFLLKQLEEGAAFHRDRDERRLGRENQEFGF